MPYYDAFLNNQPRPVFDWYFAADGSIVVETTDTPKAVNLWHAGNPTARDFRMVTIGPTWTSTPLADQGDGTYVGQAPSPATGWTASFVELVYDSPFQGADAFDYHFTTELRVLPETLPFEADFNRDTLTDVLDLVVFNETWLTENDYRDIAPRRTGDGIVNLHDFALLRSHWLQTPH